MDSEGPLYISVLAGRTMSGSLLLHDQSTQIPRELFGSGCNFIHFPLNKLH